MKKIRASILVVFMFSVFLNFGSNTVFAKTQTIKMVSAKMSMYAGESKTVKLKLSNVDAKKIKWKSSRPSVVSVDGKGSIKGISKGTSSVTAYLPSTRLQATAIITVNQKTMNAQEVFNKVNPSIVYIEAFNASNQKISSGSGVIVQQDGGVLTNHHVIVDIDEISYVMIHLANGQVFKTDKVIGYDAKRDLALLKIDGVNNLKAVNIGRSEQVKTGDKIFALGSPLGKQNSITEGIISNLSIVEDGLNFFQFTAPISPGNSGGALVNSYGELIGITVASFTNAQNMNLAIPAKDYINLDSSVDMTISEVNQEYYVPVDGKGTTIEKEPNDDLDSANEVVFSEGVLGGTLKDSQDMDLYYFLVTKPVTITIAGTTVDPNFSEDFGISIYDEDGVNIQDGQVKFYPDYNSYACSFTQVLKPGYYHIGIYAFDETKLTYSNTEYQVYYKIE